ncbi:hypothetical protein [Streptomyces albireticuli]|uniref:Uncharacterized protein n=1 Tax=Streptomyces albireticuli TaxID=1940 RepID=A0A2A2D668_9ACTN|nr:hypothetical protein [Streptomyces albireticuli]MCD9145908.1 hypothetical protein [Streptomyces albireticuli]MCD9166078.1 hypothetical protein [Streptomyces albireticuli]MCD9196358.1 hypothetical protein [Streptomyces albireticuli]PAU47978.1 hypothetical protein CK936_15830 [Streptomyces albireticuli]
MPTPGDLKRTALRNRERAVAAELEALYGREDPEDAAELARIRALPQADRFPLALDFIARRTTRSTLTDTQTQTDRSTP